MSKNDFGFYGSGLDGYVHYKQSVDRINQSAPMRKYEVKSQKNRRKSNWDRLLSHYSEWFPL